MKPTPYDKRAFEPQQYAFTPPVYTPAPAKQFYPDYYILKIDDIVEGFVQQWDRIITTEIMAHPIQSNIVLPEVWTIGPDGSLHKQVYFKEHVSERAKPWHPDISIIIGAAMEAIKSKSELDTDMDLVLGSIWVDVAYAADIQLRSNVGWEFVNQAISNARQQIAKLAVEFGKQLFQRLIEFKLYSNGTFPYHYVGWEGDCAVVALDDDPQVDICTM